VTRSSRCRGLLGIALNRRALSRNIGIARNVELPFETSRVELYTLASRTTVPATPSRGSSLKLCSTRTSSDRGPTETSEVSADASHVRFFTVFLPGINACTFAARNSALGAPAEAPVRPVVFRKIRADAAAVPSVETLVDDHPFERKIRMMGHGIQCFFDELFSFRVAGSRVGVGWSCP